MSQVEVQGDIDTYVLRGRTDVPLGGIDHYQFLSLMRTYTPYDRTKQGSQSGKKAERKSRTSNEWDIRIDCDSAYADRIVKYVQDSPGCATYILVSGIEQPDNATISWGSKSLHVHIALVTEYQLRRDQALALVRGAIPTTEEYAVPRNTRFTYAGWYLHHTKLDWKLVKEPAIRYEYGLLPADPLDVETKTKVQAMFKKFGRDEDAHEANNKKKFGLWLD